MKDLQLKPSTMTSTALTGATALRQNLPARDARVNCVARQTLVMFPILGLAYARLAISEEREVKAQFGTEYEQYSHKTPRFVPRLTGR